MRRLAGTLLCGITLLLLMPGCTNDPVLNVDYLGQTYTATDTVDIYFSKEGVKQPFDVMGRMSLDVDDFTGPQQLEEVIRQQAALRGADGVIVTGYGTRPTGSTITYGFDDWNDFYGPWGYPVGFGPAEGVAMTQSIQEKQVQAELIKYKANEASEQPLEPAPGAVE